MKTWLKKSRGVCRSVSGIFKVGVFFLFLALGSSAMASQALMDREEIIRRSNLIFVGSVLEKNARWNEMGNLIVTDYVFAVDDVLFGEIGGEKLSLTFAGGQLPEEGQSVSGVPKFNTGDRVLLMLEKSDNPLLSPITGGDQGKFLAGEIDNSGNRVVLDGSNRIMKTADGKTIFFKDFVKIVKKEIAIVKGKPSRK